MATNTYIGPATGPIGVANGDEADLDTATVTSTGFGVQGSGNVTVKLVGSTINSTDRGITDGAAGTLTVNVDANSTITGRDGVGSDTSVIALTNAGTISSNLAGDNGVYIGQNGSTVVNSGTIRANPGSDAIYANGSVTITNSGALNGTSASAGALYLNSGGTLNLSDGVTPGTISGGVAFNAALNISTKGLSETLGSALSGSGALTKIDAGALTLTNTNTYSGGTTISAGTLVEQNTGAALGSGTVAIAAAATLELNAGANDFAQNGGTFTGTGTITKTGADSVAFGNNGNVNVNLSAGALIDVQAGSLSGSASNQGIWTNNFASLNIASGATFNTVEGAVRVDKLSGSGTLTGGYGGTRTITIGDADGSGSFSGLIQDNSATDNLAVTKVGSGNETFNGASTYSGGTTISAGQLSLGNVGGVGTGAVVDNANLLFAADGIVTNSISGSGTLFVASNHTLQFNGALTQAGFTIGTGVTPPTVTLTQSYAPTLATTVNNFGTLNSPGVNLIAASGGGVITNGSATNTSARIEGGASAVNVSGSAATEVDNYGLIEGDQNSGAGAASGSGAFTLKNIGANSFVEAPTYGAFQVGTGALNVTNAGLILGGSEGAYAAGGPANITNTGTIAAGTYGGGGVVVGGDHAVLLGAGGAIVNSGTIESASDGVLASGNTTLVNSGTIKSTVNSGLATNGGTVTVYNAANGVATGQINGGSDSTYGYGLQVHGATLLNVFNNGVINGSQGGIVSFDNAVNARLFSGSTTGAIKLSGGADTVSLYTGEVGYAQATVISPINGSTIVTHAAGDFRAASFGAIALGAGANTLNLRGSGVLARGQNGEQGLLDLTQVTAAGGSYALAKVDAGKWTLTGTANVSSASVAAGELDLGLNALGAAAIATTAGSTTVFGSTTTQTETGTVTGGGALTYALTGGGAVTVGGALSGFSGPLTVTGGDLFFAGTTQLGTGTSKTLNNAVLHYTGMFNNGLENGTPATLALNGTTDGIDTGSVGLNVFSTISGAAQLVKTGAGVLQIYSANNAGFTGGVAVNAGTLELDASGAVGTGQVALAAGVTLNAFATTANAVAVNGSATLHVNTSGSTTLSGGLSGAGALNATGAGLVLGSAAGYTGAFTDNLTGTLELGSGAALGSSFAFGSATRLQLDGQAAGGQFTSTLSGLAGGDQLDARGVGTASTAVLVGNDVQLRSSAGAVLYTFHLASAASVANDYFTTAADGNGGSTLFVNLNANAPVITSGGVATEVQFTPATTVVYTTTASDADAGNVLTYAISGGPDAVDFNINATTGAVTFKASPSFNAPIDQGMNNVYDIVVAANDGLHNTTKAVAISVTNSVTNSPTVVGVINPAPATEAGDASAQDIPATATSIQVRDADTTGQLTATTSSGATATLNGAAVPAGTTIPAALTQASALTFTGAATANGGVVSITGAYDPTPANLDFLAAGDVLTLSFPVTVTDSVGHTATTTVTATVNGTNDAPVLTNATAAAGLAPFGSTLVLQPSIGVFDADRNATGSGAQVAITAGFSVGDQLTVASPQAGITAAYDAATGVLTLTGAASDAAYQAELRSVTYGRTAIDSGAGTRGFSFTVTDDQGASSAPVTETLTAGFGNLGGGGGGTVATNLDVQQAFPTQTSNLLRTSASDPALSNPTSPLYAQAQAEKGIAAQLDNGQISLADAQNALYHLVDGTTSVAEISYAFFTGRTPTQAGLNYLVHSDANATDLNDPYYARFTTENRYINFAVNLATGVGAGAAAFQSNYGSLSLADATTKAYALVFGTAPDAGKVDAILNAQVSNGLGGTETRAQYFSDITGGSAAAQKAAAIGFLLSDSVKEGFGTYQQADLHFLADLAHGTAVFNVDLLAAYSQSPSLVGQAVLDSSLPH